MNVPLLDLKAQFQLIREEVQAVINQVLESQHFILGPEVDALEKEVAEYTHSNFGVGVSSGTDALLLCLMVLGIKQGDEVIVPTYTFFATAAAVVRLGAKPVFVDIEPYSYDINADEIEALITPRTKAIIAVHLFGQMAEMNKIMQIAQKHNLVIIEDAAQAIGSEYQGQRAGTIGHMACFSFFPSKNLGGIGDGGMVTTNDPELNERLRLFRNHGYQPKYYNRVVGGNFRLDAIQAAVLRVKLRYLDNWTEGRQKNANYYRQYLKSSNAQQAICLQENCIIAKDEGKCQLGAKLMLPSELPNRRHIYNQFVIRSNQRAALQKYLHEHGIGTEIYYPLPLHLQECFTDLNYNRGDFPVSECAASQTLALPIYPELSETQLHTVVTTIERFFTE